MTQSTAFSIAPGGWLGLLGGGQLGRMFCHAAQSLGYKVAVLDPAEECPAGMVADLHIRAAYDDEAGLARLAQQCRAVTTEFENVPADSLRALAARCRVSPAADAVAVVQDRIAEKPSSPRRAFPSRRMPRSEARPTCAPRPPTCSPASSRLPAWVTTAGPGPHRHARGSAGRLCRIRWRALRAGSADAAGLRDLRGAGARLRRRQRGVSGGAQRAPRRHPGGVHRVGRRPGRGHAERQARATAAAQSIAQGLGYHGVLCVEFFVLRTAA